VPAQTFPKLDPTIGTALFAIRNPDLVDRVVFFAPTARREARSTPATRIAELDLPRASRHPLE
jgi:hypothetical protein